MMIIAETAADCNNARMYAERRAFSAVRKGGGKECVQTICTCDVWRNKTKLYRFFISIIYKESVQITNSRSQQHDGEQIVAANERVRE